MKYLQILYFSYYSTSLHVTYATIMKYKITSELTKIFFIKLLESWSEILRWQQTIFCINNGLEIMVFYSSKG